MMNLDLDCRSGFCGKCPWCRRQAAAMAAQVSQSRATLSALKTITVRVTIRRRGHDPFVRACRVTPQQLADHTDGYRATTEDRAHGIAKEIASDRAIKALFGRRFSGSRDSVGRMQILSPAPHGGSNIHETCSVDAEVVS